MSADREVRDDRVIWRIVKRLADRAEGEAVTVRALLVSLVMSVGCLLVGVVACAKGEWR